MGQVATRKSINFFQKKSGVRGSNKEKVKYNYINLLKKHKIAG